MKSLKLIMGSAIAASYLFAIDPVTNLSLSTPYSDGNKHNGDVSFTWTPPTETNGAVSKYYYVLDTNSSNINVDASSSKVAINSSTETSVSITPSTSGNYYLHLIAVAADGTASAVSTTQTAAKVDIDKGTVTVSPDGGALSGATTLTMSESEDGTIYYTTDGSTPDTSSSVYSEALSIVTAKTVKAILVDTAGNVGDAVTKVFTSSVNPTLKTTSDLTTLSGQVFATVNTNGATPKTSLTVGGDGFTKYKYKFSTDSSYSALTDIGTVIDLSQKTTSNSYTISLLGADAYNTQSESSKTDFAFTIDNTKPSNLHSSVDGNTTKTSFNDNFTFVLSGSDNVDSSLTYQYTLDGSDPKTTGTASNTGTTTKTVATGETSSFSLKFAAKDDAGNWSDTKSVTYTIDKEKATLTMPSASTFSEYFDTTISMSEDGDIYYELEEITTTTCSPNKTIQTIDDNKYANSVTVAKSASGTVTLSNICLYAKAVDIAGNESTVSSTLFTYNASSVTLNLTNVTNGTSIATVSTYGATPISSIGIDGNNIDAYDSFKNTIAVDTNESWNSSSYIDISSYSEGDYNVTVSAYDTSKTYESNSTISFTIDNTQPTTIILDDVNFSSSTTATLTLPTNATEIYTALTDIGESLPSSFDLLSGTEVDITASKTLWIKTKDEAGNESNVTSADFTKTVATTTLSIANGWSMVALPVSGVYNSSDIFNTALISWKYNQDTNWTAYSSTYESMITTKGYTAFATVESGEGVWVLTDANQTIDFNSTSTYSAISSAKLTDATTGWHLLGTGDTISSSAVLNANSAVSIIWNYDNSNTTWSAYSADTDINTELNSSSSVDLLETIPTNSAFWILVE